MKATLRKSKQVNISFDEWNVWYEQSEPMRAVAQGWPVGPALFEQRYSVADAVVVGGLLIALMRHSDRVVSANLAQLVNVIAPIMTEANGDAWRQTTYYPFAQAATSASGSVLLSKLVAPVVGTAKWGEVPVVDAVATHDPDQGEMALFIVNRSVDQDVQLTVRTPGVRPTRIASATVLCDDDPHRIARVDASLSPRDNQLVEIDEAWPTDNTPASVMERRQAGDESLSGSQTRDHHPSPPVTATLSTHYLRRQRTASGSVDGSSGSAAARRSRCRKPASADTTAIATIPAHTTINQVSRANVTPITP